MFCFLLLSLLLLQRLHLSDDDEPPDVYLQRMRTQGTWGDNITAEAAANLYQLHIRIIKQVDNAVNIIDVKPPPEAQHDRLQLITLIHYENWHYLTCIPEAANVDTTLPPWSCYVRQGLCPARYVGSVSGNGNRPRVSTIFPSHISFTYLTCTHSRYLTRTHLLMISYSHLLTVSHTFSKQDDNSSEEKQDGQTKKSKKRKRKKSANVQQKVQSFHFLKNIFVSFQFLLPSHSHTHSLMIPHS